MNHTEFQNLVRAQGRELYRDMTWRRDTRPYYILVSELMLQQTQVARVIPKFEAFIAQFPGVEALAAAPLADVLRAWTGLGYNRRARYLHEAAKQVVANHGRELPAEYGKLKNLPGIGPATAGAVMAYAFNQPVVFIETNVRTVYFEHFFKPADKVRDTQLVPLIEATLPAQSPREFYWALMDYGSWLKQKAKKDVVSQSAHYRKQSTFKGSVRETRGQIVRLLGSRDMTLLQLKQDIEQDGRFELALAGLLRDGLVTEADAVFHLTK